MQLSKIRTQNVVTACVAKTRSPMLFSARLRRRASFAGVFLLLVLHPGGYADAQTTASITGRVTDPLGAVVAGQKVSLVQPDTGLALQEVTNHDGIYSFASLPPGNFEATIVKNGFKKAIQTVVLEVGGTAVLDFSLTLGSATETVIVNSSSSQMDRQESGLSYVINSAEVADMPLDGRNPYALAGLLPGVVAGDSFGAGLSSTREAVISAATNNFETNGGIAGSNEILLDGISIVVCCQGQPPVTPSVEVVDQFRVATSVPPAQYGRSSGGVLNIVTKSGTNRLHGDLYEFLRNDQLDAANFFVKRTGIYPIPTRHDFRSPLRFNQFGAFVSGPVTLPHVYNGRDKTFFAFGYEGARSLSTTYNLVTVPTALMRQGVFTEVDAAVAATTPGATATPIYDPNTHAPLAAGCDPSGTCYPAGRYVANITPIASQILPLIPSPNLPGVTNNFAYFTEPSTNNNQWNARIDQDLNGRTRLFVRGTRLTDSYYSPGFTKQPNVQSFGQTISGYLFAAGVTWTATPSLLVQITYGFNYQYNHQSYGNFGMDAAAFGFSSQFMSEQPVKGFPRVTITDLQTLGSETENLGDQYTHVLSVASTLQLGKHTILSGYDGRYFLENSQNVADLGSFGFDSSLTRGSNTATSAGQVPFDSFAAFLLGTPSTAGVTRNLTLALSQPYHAVYVQDNWRAGARLTLNLGLRGQMEMGFRERNNHWADFDPNASNPLSSPALAIKGGAQYLGQPGNPDRTWKTSYTLSPRVGFAFTPNPTLVIRSAYGILFLPTTQRAYQAIPMGYSQTTEFQVTSSTSNSVAFSNPFPNGVALPQGPDVGVEANTGTLATGLIYNTPEPYQQQWNIGIEQQLAHGVYLRINYAGGHGTKLPITGHPNDLQPQYFGAVGDMNQVNHLNAQVANPFYGDGVITPFSKLSAKTVALQQLLSAYPQYSPSTGLSNSGVGILDDPAGSVVYNALQTGIVFQTKSLRGTVFYTWSKLLGNVSDLTTGFLNATGNPTYQNYYFRKGYERSVLVTDRPHRVVGNFIYTLPFGRGQRFGNYTSAWVNAIAGGWTLNGIGAIQSGTPLAFTQTGGASFSPSRPTYVPGVQPLTTGSMLNRLGGPGLPGFLNPLAYQLSKSFQLGNVPFAAALTRSPIGFQDDLSVRKTFPLKASTRLEVRIEAFNVLNAVQFGLPNTQVNGTTFGQITKQANTPREIQGALKFYY